MTANAPHSIVATDQTMLSYRDLRSGGDSLSGTIVLLHSLGADGHMWDACLPALSRAYRVIVPDTRGHGSSAPSPTASVERWVEDLHAMLAEADTGPVLMAGVSMGGIQALAYAATYPQGVQALVVADSFAALDPAVAEAKIVAIAGQARSKPMAQVADQYVADTFRPPLPDGAEAVRRALAGMDPTSYIAAAETCFGAQITDLLHKVKAPTRVLWGERDAKTPRPLSEQIARAVPNAHLRVIRDAGHLSNADNPDAFVAEILQLSERTHHKSPRRAPKEKTDHG